MKTNSDEDLSLDQIVIRVKKEDLSEFRRLDQMLAAKLPEFSRSLLKKIYELDQIYWHEDHPFPNKKLELKKMPKADSLIVVNIPAPIPSEAAPENIPLEILYEDEHLLFVNKPAGLVTHPAPGNYTGTLVNAILYHCKDLTGVGCVKRPGIVHRLDKGTSGVMVVAKTQKCHEGLVELFSKHDINRVYEAMIVGSKIRPSGTVQSKIGRHPNNRLKMSAKVKNGKEAITHYKVLGYYNGLTHIELKLETGRTHQIRVHMGEVLHRSILGDTVYGTPAEQLKNLDTRYRQILNDYPYPLLHAKTLGFIHPITGESLEFSVPRPSVFEEVYQLALAGA